MARLATDADFRPSRGETIGLGVVILAQAGRVALRAHEIPVLVQLGPVQDIVVLDLLVGIEVKPALAAFFLRPAVPGDRQCLNTTVGEFDEVLLQRIDAERVFHLEHGKLAVGTVGFDEEFSVLAEEARMHAVIIEACVVEIAEHRLVGRVLHRRLVLRGLPQSCFRLMAACAGLAADEGRGGAVLRGYPTAVAQVKAKTGGNDDQYCGHRRNPDQASREEGGFGSVGNRLLRRRDLPRLSGRPLPRSIGIAGFASLACQRRSPSVPGSAACLRSGRQDALRS